MSELSLSALTSRPDKLAAKHGNMYLSACRKSLFSPLNKFSELHKSSENLGFQWRRETGEAPPVADQARAVSRKAPKQRIRRIRCLACGDGVSLLGLSPRQEPPYGGCAPKHACGRRPAHTLHPQGVCSIRRAAKPLTAALPYRRGEFSALSTDSFITLNGVVPILGQLHVYSGKIDICDRFAMQKHRRMKNVRFPRPCGATGNDTRKLHAPALRIFMARCSCVKFFA